MGAGADQRAVREARAVRALLPPGAFCSLGRGGAGETGGYPEELALIGPEYAPGRLQSVEAREHARVALRQLGVAPAAIPRGPGGAPHWPPHVIGSLSHSGEYRAAAVARASRYRGIGIDVETRRRLAPGLVATFTHAVERRQMAALEGDYAPDSLPVAAFCAKEAAFKALYPATGVWMGMREVIARFQPRGRFLVRPAAAPERGAPALSIAGRWAALGEIVVAVAVLRHLPLPGPGRRPGPIG